MDTKGQRESRQITGQDDNETIQDITQKKKARQKKNVPAEVSDSRSVYSEMSDLTKYSSSTKASQERKYLRSQVEDQQEALDAKDDEIARLKELVAKQTLEGSKDRMDNLSVSEHTSGENTSESPPSPHGGYGEWNFDDVTDMDSRENERDEEVEVIKVKRPKPPSKPHPEGLEMTFRGPPKQVQAVADHYAKQGVNTIQTLPYRDGTITKVDLYKVVDEQKFKADQHGQSHLVKFATEQTVQEYDTGTIKLQSEKKEIVDFLPLVDSGEDSESVSSNESNYSDSRSRSSISQSSDSDSSSTSSNSDTLPPVERNVNIKKKKETKKTPHKRATSITVDTLSQARQILNEVNIEESDGKGPTINE